MKVLNVSMEYGERSFNATIHPPSSMDEYMWALATLTHEIDAVACDWAFDARRAFWEQTAEARTTVEEF